MRNPKVVLNSLASKSSDYTYQRLYRNLYNIEFYLEAYAKIYPNKCSRTSGINIDTIDKMSLKRINTLIESLRSQSYQPKSIRRSSNSKKNREVKPAGIPTFEDQLLQEVVRRILESIYEHQLSENSHAFRPNKSCHTALKQIKNTFISTRWFIERDIEAFFDSINHHTLIYILRRKMKDEKFINLIWKFLRAGYGDDWGYNRTYSGTPQGGIISPILSNIYLNELDQYIETYIKKFNKYGYHNQASNMKYVRYADKFLIGVNASKKEAKEIKNDVTVFLSNKLKLERSTEKTLITHGKMKVRFLGYDIRVVGDWQRPLMTKSIQKNKVNHQVKLFVPSEQYINKLIDLGALSLGKNNQWKPIHRPYLVHCNDLEIIRQYNSEIRGIYNYYRLASNVQALQSFRQTMKYSMIKTFANKYNSTLNKIINKYSINGHFGIQYTTKDGPCIAYFIDQNMEKELQV